MSSGILMEAECCHVLFASWTVDHQKNIDWSLHMVSDPCLKALISSEEFKKVVETCYTCR